MSTKTALAILQASPRSADGSTKSRKMGTDLSVPRRHSREHTTSRRRWTERSVPFFPFFAPSTLPGSNDSYFVRPLPRASCSPSARRPPRISRPRMLLIPAALALVLTLRGAGGQNRVVRKSSELLPQVLRAKRLSVVNNALSEEFLRCYKD
jgi:hypothetical protein